MAAIKNPKRQQWINRRRLLLLGIFLLFLYVLVPRIGGFKTSIGALEDTDVRWLVICLAGLLMSYGFAATTYMLLAKRRLGYGATLMVQVASMFTNRLLPAGVGAIGINFAYLRRNKHSASEAAGVVATNNLLGFVGHLLLFLAVVAVGRHGLVPLHRPSSEQLDIGVGIVLLITIAVYLVARSRHRRSGHFLRSALANIAAYRQHPGRLALALVSSLLLTSCYAVMLFAASRAIGLHLPMDRIFIVLSLGVAGATAIPTPGGLGGAEASIVGGLTLYGVSGGDALAAALLYRLFTYWLALVIGLVGFLVAQKARYI